MKHLSLDDDGGWN